MRIDSISGLQAFVAAADCRSFTRAGEVLGISSSAIGKAIARLEDQLATQLFHRTTRAVSLTESGILFLVRTKKILEQLDDAEAELASTTAEPRGRLRLSLPLTGSFLTGALAEYLLRHPQIELELDYSDRMVDVIEEGFDAVIRTGQPADSRLKHRKLGSFGWQLVASPRYLEKAGTPRTVADLANHICLRQRTSTGRIAPWPFRGEREEPVAPAQLTASIIDPLLDFVIADAGIGAFPKFMVDHQLASGSLVAVLDGVLERVGVLNILWPDSRHLTPKTRSFVDFMQGWAKTRFS